MGYDLFSGAFGGDSSGSSYSSSSTPNMSLYQQAMSLNQQNYQNILSGYQSALGNIQSQIGGITAGYSTLGQQVQNTISGVGAAERQSIKDVYAQQTGQATQQLATAGLGNTTVTQSVRRGLTLDEQKAQVALAGQIAQLRAGYQAQIGMAGLGAQMQGIGMETGLSGQYLGALAGYRYPYPPSSSQGGGGSFGGGGQPRGGGGGQPGGGGGYPSGLGGGGTPGYYGGGGGGGADTFDYGGGSTDGGTDVGTASYSMPWDPGTSWSADAGAAAPDYGGGVQIDPSFYFNG